MREWLRAVNEAVAEGFARGVEGSGYALGRLAFAAGVLLAVMAAGYVLLAAGVRTWDVVDEARLRRKMNGKGGGR